VQGLGVELVENFKENKLLHTFLREKPGMALISLSDQKTEWYASLLAKKIDCTYPHMVKLMANFTSLGLIKQKNKGRKRIITLTNKGSEIAHDLESLVMHVSKL